jgi:hypothetical protein
MSIISNWKIEGFSHFDVALCGVYYEIRRRKCVFIKARFPVGKQAMVNRKLLVVSYFGGGGGFFKKKWLVLTK